jgi:hypothetical protein
LFSFLRIFIILRGGKSCPKHYFHLFLCEYGCINVVINDRLDDWTLNSVPVWSGSIDLDAALSQGVKNSIDDRALSTWSTPPHRPHSLARAPHACRTAADQWETREPNRFSRPAPHHRSDATRRPTSPTLTDDSGSASRPTTPSLANYGDPRAPIRPRPTLPASQLSLHRFPPLALQASNRRDGDRRTPPVAGNLYLHLLAQCYPYRLDKRRSIYS